LGRDSLAIDDINLHPVREIGELLIGLNEERIDGRDRAPVVIFIAIGHPDDQGDQEELLRAPREAESGFAKRRHDRLDKGLSVAPVADDREIIREPSCVEYGAGLCDRTYHS
jgi:hypothetical protein